MDTSMDTSTPTDIAAQDSSYPPSSYGVSFEDRLRDASGNHD